MFLVYPVVVCLKESALFNYFDPQLFTQYPIAVKSVFGFATESFQQISLRPSLWKVLLTKLHDP